MNSKNKQPSNAVSPDLDWSQVRETVRMLNLAVAQIEMAMRDGDDSVNALSTSFTSMIGSVNAIARSITVLPRDDRGVKDSIESDCATVTGQIQSAIIAFQFYDRLSQRLSHVNQSLAALSELVSDQTRIYEPPQWHALQQRIRSKYTMREEQEMFDALLRGATIDEALEVLEELRRESDRVDDIELF